MSKALFHLRPVEIQIRQNWCKGCGICTALCPKKVLALDDRGKVVVVNGDACTGCKMCETHCPDFAISVGVMPT
ncbi:ferredoxin [Clostridiales bacterium PH28_bin88]|nr:ferredoxin [Clostridiales bacterium PH28_bin88]